MFALHEVYTVAFLYPKHFSRFKSILIGSKEKKFPLVNILLVFNAFFNIWSAELFASIFLAISDNHAKHIFRAFFLEVNRRRNWKSPFRTLIRERNGSEKSWFLQGNACQGNSSKLQSLTAEVCRTFTGMLSWYSDKLSAQNMQISPCGVIFFQGLDGTSGTLFFKSLQFFHKGG